MLKPGDKVWYFDGRSFSFTETTIINIHKTGELGYSEVELFNYKGELTKKYVPNFYLYKNPEDKTKLIIDMEDNILALQKNLEELEREGE